MFPERVWEPAGYIEVKENGVTKELQTWSSRPATKEDHVRRAELLEKLKK